MGSLIVDPTLPFSKGSDGEKSQEGYPGLTAQNRYYAIQFATDYNARVVPQCLGTNNFKTYNQQQANQHKNILMVQRNSKNSQNTGTMRIFFAKGMKSRLVFKNGWYFLKEGNAYLAVKAFDLVSGNVASKMVWDNEFWLRPTNPNAPVVLIGGRINKFPTLNDFITYVSTIQTNWKSNKFTLNGKDTDGIPTSLSMYTNYSGIPEVNGSKVNFTPKKLYNSPFLESIYGSGIITIKKTIGSVEQKIVHNFNATRAIPSTGYK
jgi:hypothetical protein